jgi:hypothetical protein
MFCQFEKAVDFVRFLSSYERVAVSERDKGDWELEIGDWGKEDR